MTVSLTSFHQFHVIFVYSALKYPSNLSELNALASLLTKYTDHNMAYVLLLFCSAYVYKQAFAIPGSVFLVNELVF